MWLAEYHIKFFKNLLNCTILTIKRTLKTFCEDKIFKRSYPFLARCDKHKVYFIIYFDNQYLKMEYLIPPKDYS